MKEIVLTQGKVAFVDDGDFDELNSYKWQAHKAPKTYYAVRSLPRENGKRPYVRMHDALLGKQQYPVEIDHKDGNGLNNQKDNLRLVTHRQNTQNKKNSIKTSAYPGVCFDKRSGKWRSTITINKKFKHLGLFEKEYDAFNAYRKAVCSIGEKVVGD